MRQSDFLYLAHKFEQIEYKETVLSYYVKSQHISRIAVLLDLTLERWLEASL